MATDKRIASDGKEIMITDTAYGGDMKLSVTKPTMARDVDRAGKDVYVLPCWHVFYDENGYCVKCLKSDIPDDIYDKLVEDNK